MNPADVAQSALPLASADVSLIALFLQAHWVVKAVMLGLLACSVWVWAIAIDKIFLYSRTKRAMDRFEQAFWSGQSIEELYRALSAKPTQSMAACFVAAMREWKRSFESQTRSFAGLQMRIEKVMNVSIAREVERALFEGKNVQRCLVDLLARESKDELADFGRWMARLEEGGEAGPG